MAFNLAEQGEGLGAFLTAIEDPVTNFILALVFIGAIAGLVGAIVFVIRKAMKK